LAFKVGKPPVLPPVPPPVPPRRPRPRPPPTETVGHPSHAPFPGRPAPCDASKPVCHAIRVACTRRTSSPSAVWSRPCRASLAVRRHGCHRFLGELLPAPSTKLRTHAHLFLVTCNTSPHHALHRPRRRLAGSQAAATRAAQHHRPTPSVLLCSRLRPRLGRR
jgi:hypothetical protein